MSRGTPFQPGNKFGRGRPCGSRNKSTLLKLGLLESHAESLIKKCIVMALNGDRAAMRMCMDRLIPRRHSAPVQLRMTKINTVSDVREVGKELVHAVASGQITPTEGQQMMTMLEAQRQTIELYELDQRLQKVEQHIAEPRAA
jgi:hypothetical protein